MTLRLRVICRQAIMLAVVLAVVLTAAVPAALAQSASPTTLLVYEWYRSGWIPLTPPQVTVQFDPYSPSDARNLVVFKNRHR